MASDPVNPVPALPDGAALRVIAPSGVVDLQKVERGRQILAAAGVPTSLSPLLDRVDPQAPYLAGDDEARARELVEAFEDDEVAGIICARGGYGAMRLLRRLDPAVFRRHPKPLVGFSDITAISGFLAAKAGMASLHGPLLTTLALHEGDPHASVEAMVRALKRPGEAIEVGGMVALHEGEAQGHLVGGNLSLVACLVGTPWFPAVEGAILFLEEVGESAYRADRLLTQLELCGVFDAVAGIALGDVGETGDRYVPGERLGSSVVSRLGTLTASRGIPVAVGLPVGHGVSNLTLPFGRQASLVCESGVAKLVAAPAVV